MTQPSQQPPDSRGKRAMILIICDHLCATLNPDSAELMAEQIPARQRMSPGLIGNNRAAEVIIQVQVMCAGDMIFKVLC